MKTSLPVSEEILNAYIDDEIDAEERERVARLEMEDRELAHEICEQRRLKTLVKLARAEEPSETANIVLHRSVSFKSWSMAVSTTLVVFIVFTLAVNQKETAVVSYMPGSTYSDFPTLLSSVGKKNKLKLVLHLKTADKFETEHLFQVLTTLMDKHKHTSSLWQIEVVASGAGMQILLDNNTQYASQIARLRSRHPNIAFIACAKTLKKMSINESRSFRISRQTMLVASGPDWAKQRQQQGWAYILI